MSVPGRLRVLGFVMVVPVDLLWWTPVDRWVEASWPGGFPETLVLVLGCGGLLAWVAAFVISMLGAGEGGGSSRRRVVSAVIRVILQWVLAILILPILMVAVLTILVMVGGAGPV